jgi:hypothetical protein
VQIAHGATRSLDRPATEYPTCLIITGPLHQVSYSYHNPRHYTQCHTCTPQDKQTRFSKRNKDKRKTK